jgi:hypothetical protein
MERVTGPELVVKGFLALRRWRRDCVCKDSSWESDCEACSASAATGLAVLGVKVAWGSDPEMDLKTAERLERDFVRCLSSH